MQLHNTITRTIDGTRYTLDHGTISMIAFKRERARSAARCGSARDNAMILRDLRKTVAARLEIDQRTAYALLASIKYGQLFK